MKIGTFTNQNWDTIINAVAKVLGDEVATALKANPVAKYIGSVAYWANSEDPDRYAVANVILYYAASKATEVFGHRASDDKDPLNRLGAGTFGKKANKQVIKQCAYHLLWLSIQDHIKDAKADEAAGKANPVNAGTITPKMIEKVKKITAKSSPLSASFSASAGWSL